MNHTIKHANAENHSCTVVLKRLILKEILSANFWHFTFIYTRKEGSNERINLTKKVCMQKNQFEITVLWQFKRLLRYNRPLRSTFKSSQNTAFRQFNFMCLDVVRWTAHLGKVEKEENKFHNVYLFCYWVFWMIWDNAMQWLHFFQKWGVSRSWKILWACNWKPLCQLCDASKPRSAVRQCHRLSICFSYLIWQIVK